MRRHKSLYPKYRWHIVSKSCVTTIQVDKPVVDALKKLKDISAGDL